MILEIVLPLDDPVEHVLVLSSECVDIQKLEVPVEELQDVAHCCDEELARQALLIHSCLHSPSSHVRSPAPDELWEIFGARIPSDAANLWP